MEHLNKIELCGIVGSFRFTTVCNKRMATFSVATNYMYKDSQGCPVIETTWHQIKAWEGDGLDALSKGSKVHVLGRLWRIRSKLTPLVTLHRNFQWDLKADLTVVVWS